MSLRLAAVMFGVLWTLAMLWWSAPLDTAAYIIWPITGAMTAFAWYWMMSLWMKLRTK
jgi:hypothetical protein